MKGERAVASERVSLAVFGVPAGEAIALGRLSRPSLLVTLETSAVEVAIGVSSKSIVVDRTSFLVVPKRSLITVRSRTPANRVAVLGLDETLVRRVEHRYRKLGLDRARLDGWLGEVALLSRTVWVHEIVHRYVFERDALGERDNLATRFLEIEILKEVYFLFRDRDDEGSDRESAGQKYSGPVERAVAWIEAHVFDRGDVKELARRSGASESTLLRSFRRELGCTPGTYWRTRKLDESMVLLRTGRYSIAEVARRAGYEKPTSFGFAFRARFGSPPTAFVRRRPTKRAP
jgi:AraC-like DNA-binding protein